MSVATITEAESIRHAPPVATEAGERLTFRLGGEAYGIDILRVQEIRGYEAPTRIANAPACILGVLNLRGVIVPIVDLRIRFGFEQVVYDALTVTVVLNVGGRTVGVVVDSVSDVVELTGDQIKPAPAFSANVAADHIVGIGTLPQGEREQLLILVDIERLMADPAMGLVEFKAH